MRYKDRGVEARVLHTQVHRTGYVVGPVGRLWDIWAALRMHRLLTGQRHSSFKPVHMVKQMDSVHYVSHSMGSLT